MAVKHFLAGFTIGGLCGLAAGVLGAIKPGDILRAELKEQASKRMQDAREKVSNVKGKVTEKTIEVLNNVELGVDRVKAGFTHAKDALGKQTSAIGRQLKNTADKVGERASLLKEELEIKKAS